MISFECDYMEGAHPAILNRLIETNMEQLPGYGTDHYTEEARQVIREACGCPEGQVFFFAGGTQTNITIIDAILRPYDGIISADTGHVNVHEAGGVERFGHKVLAIETEEGKLQAAEVKALIEEHRTDESWDHMVFPGGVYVSHPTELGTLYTREELAAISEVCHEYRIPLYLDGARLGYALASPANDLTLQDIAELCDVFYIGGTKVGALCGEAVVFPKGNAPENFFTIMKQRGCVFAKHRVVSLQFLTLFEDDLYLKLGAHAIEMTERLKEAFRSRKYVFYLESPTNQQFLVMENEKIPQLREKMKFEVVGRQGSTHSIVRFCTSWATKPEDIDELARILDECVKGDGSF